MPADCEKPQTPKQNITQLIICSIFNTFYSANTVFGELGERNQDTCYLREKPIEKSAANVEQIQILF